ncbi:unnamed protein product [Leptidea sinapis]|uniref:Uncharacterized protein n=1 Tax=Leptidea sinapis TaxID=189913 RepID=A0A5E4PS48_9NEOP|nr:unnamed protein product [Leptidea sinapis]
MHVCPNLGWLKKVTPYDVASLVRKAFNNVASIGKGESGLRATGIVPFNPDVFTEDHFIAAEILQSETIAIQDCNESLAAASAIPNTSNEIPSTSKQISEQISTNLNDLIKLPEKTHIVNTRKGRKKQHATILTSTPLKENLIEKENKKMKEAGSKEVERTMRMTTQKMLETDAWWATILEEIMRCGLDAPHVGYGLTWNALGGTQPKAMSAISARICLTPITPRVTTITPMSV